MLRSRFSVILRQLSLKSSRFIARSLPRSSSVVLSLAVAHNLIPLHRNISSSLRCSRRRDSLNHFRSHPRRFFEPGREERCSEQNEQDGQLASLSLSSLCSSSSFPSRPHLFSSLLDLSLSHRNNKRRNRTHQQSSQTSPCTSPSSQTRHTDSTLD